MYHVFSLIYVSRRRIFCSAFAVSLGSPTKLSAVTLFDWFDDLFSCFSDGEDWRCRFPSSPPFTLILRLH